MLHPANSEACSLICRTRFNVHGRQVGAASRGINPGERQAQKADAHQKAAAAAAAAVAAHAQRQSKEEQERAGKVDGIITSVLRQHGSVPVMVMPTLPEPSG